MSRRRAIQERLRGLAELRDVLAAMKNLALIEMRKLTRFLDTQRRVVESIDAALADLLAFHPALAPAVPSPPVHLLVGSERGFCADFNERIVEVAAQTIPCEPAGTSTVVGFKLASRLGDDPRVGPRIAGATVVEEVERVLTQAMEALTRPGGSSGSLRVDVIHHARDGREPRVTCLDPFGTAPTPRGRSAPILNLDPAELLRDLVRRSLDAHLHEIFYASLAAENERRLDHMERALDRLAHESARLQLRRNALRQEEITEEIEVILLTADALHPR